MFVCSVQQSDRPSDVSNTANDNCSTAYGRSELSVKFASIEPPNIDAQRILVRFERRRSELGNAPQFRDGTLWRRLYWHV